MIRALTDLSAKERRAALERIEEIFFLSSAGGGTLLGPERDEFYRRWTGYYLDEQPDLVLLAEDEDEGESGGAVVGYLMGCDRSAEAIRLFDDNFYYRAFEDCYADYPAHLHLNVLPDHRGIGVGARLVARFEDLCRERGCVSVHLITAAGARNRSFYQRVGYKTVSERRVDDRDLVLLGRKLSTKGET